ncbi:hypothetical protein Gogos_014952, partial [Gossypium gossypioides]|nr:hypothetical protein [Gossypium gossypioides]
AELKRSKKTVKHGLNQEENGGRKIVSYKLLKKWILKGWKQNRGENINSNGDISIFLTQEGCMRIRRRWETSLIFPSVWEDDWLPTLETIWYEPDNLARTGRSLGRLLRIDYATSSEIRGKFARLCVQINIEEPLKQFISVKGKRQQILYEGIKKICFRCGRMGRQRDVCPEIIISNCYEIVSRKSKNKKTEKKQRKEKKISMNIQ